MQPLLELTGLDEAERERRMRFLDFGKEDQDRLRALAPFVDSIADRVVAAFYAHVLSMPETAAFLGDPAMVARLQLAQRRHFLQLCSGPWDAAYFESRLRVGLAHARIRLPPHLYLGGYLTQMREVQQAFAEHLADDPVRSLAGQQSFLKVLMLDIALATDAYIYVGFVERGDADTRAYEATLAQEALELKLREEEKREELLRMVMHDIRSPVAAIMATARAALRRYRDTAEPPGRQFALVESTGQSVLQIIDNMVSHARAPGGELPLAPEPFDASETVSACVAQLMPFARQTGHSLRVSRLEPTPSTGLDRVLVRRVVSNLLVNACRHTPAGCRIEVECALDGEDCRIVVSDDGPGLPAAVREALQGNGSLAPREGASSFYDSGLGLPFCRKACERMGGTLEAAEGARHGTRLVVRLPADGTRLTAMLP